MVDNCFGAVAYAGREKVVTIGQNDPRYSTVRVTTRWDRFLQMVLSAVMKDVMKEDEWC